MLDINNFRVNCSQISSLVGNATDNRMPTTKEIKKLYGILGRDYGELSEKMKFDAKNIMLKPIYYDPNRPSKRILSEMVLSYAFHIYGKGKLSNGGDFPQQLEKGIAGESAAIDFLSKADGEKYQKNEEKFMNKWFQGIPDIIVRKPNGDVLKVIEVKVSLDLPSYIMTCISKQEEMRNVYELFGYMDLLKCKKGEIVHVLVDMPEHMANLEQKRLLERYKTLELDESTISDRITKVLGSMEYSNIPDDLKIFRRPFELNKYTMRTVKSRVTQAKKWMQSVHEVFTRKSVNLYDTTAPEEEQNGEDSI